MHLQFFKINITYIELVREIYHNNAVGKYNFGSTSNIKKHRSSRIKSFFFREKIGKSILYEYDAAKSFAY